MNEEVKKRVEEELQNLNEKIVKLTDFIYSGKMNKVGLSEQMKYMLKDQLSIMQRYSEILQGRLLIWDKTDKELTPGKVCCESTY